MMQPVIRQLGRIAYAETFERMQALTRRRGPDTADEIWFLEHDPVFTQGQAGRPEHLLNTGDIPVVQSDRGGQVTYHGPGQLVVYFLLDLNRLGFGIRSLVARLEQAIIDTLAEFHIQSRARRDAPGVYVDEAKIASLGLRVRNGYTYHGIAINIGMDLAPFLRINPCGYQGMQMTQISALGGPKQLKPVADRLLPHLCQQLGFIVDDLNLATVSDIQFTDKAV